MIGKAAVFIPLNHLLRGIEAQPCVVTTLRLARERDVGASPAQGSIRGGTHALVLLDGCFY